MVKNPSEQSKDFQQTSPVTLMASPTSVPEQSDVGKKNDVQLFRQLLK